MSELNDSNSLNDMQKAFANSYAFTRNGVAAARAAGYKGDADQLAVVASRLLRLVKVKNYLKGVVQPVLEKLHISKEAILSETRKIAFADLLPVKVGAKVIYAKVKRSDKIAALNLLSEWMGMGREEGYEGSRNTSLHWHEDITPEEARKGLMAFLRQQ